MWIQGHKLAILRAGLLLTFCLLVLSLFVEAGQATSLLQSSPTAGLTALATATPVPTSLSAPSTPTPTLEAVSYTQMLAVYKEVLETSKDAVASSHKMLERVVTWTTIIFGILTAAGVGALWLAWKSIGDVQVRTNELRIELESTRKFNEELRSSAKEQKKVLEEQSKRVESFSASLAQLEKEVRDVKRQASLALSDLKHIVPRLETLADVDTYAMRLFSSDGRISRVAKRTLIELSKDKDPVVRRECVRVFGAMPDCPECFVDPQDPTIISRLQKMALKDSEHGVQLEARLALNKLGVDLRDEQ
jgi:hypothetical protein